jgi:hypothetical protein
MRYNSREWAPATAFWLKVTADRCLSQSEVSLDIRYRAELRKRGQWILVERRDAVEVGDAVYGIGEELQTLCTSR